MATITIWTEGIFRNIPETTPSSAARCRGVVCVADDIVVIGCGSDDEEAGVNHDTRMKALLKRCEDLKIKLNPDKVQLRQKTIKFLGHIVTNKGLA